ncbi:hypothetical protein EON76_05125 [bacterium]|nr:MAG: hypothetical protein EON76_05125 [bacterium]
MIVKCTNCGGSHPKWDCTKPLKESTAALKEVHHRGHGGAPDRIIGQQKGGGLKPSKPSLARNQASPVDTNIIVAVDPSTGKDFGAKVIGRVLEDGRIEILSITHSKAKFSKSDYQKRYMADQRTIKRLGLSVTVKQYRESLK